MSTPCDVARRRRKHKMAAVSSHEVILYAVPVRVGECRRVDVDKVSSAEVGTYENIDTIMGAAYLF